MSIAKPLGGPCVKLDPLMVVTIRQFRSYVVGKQVRANIALAAE